MTVSAQSCLTIGGNVVGASCVFPFTYQGVQYNYCTSISEDGGSGQPWCSTGTDGNGNYISDIWGYCGPNCALFKQTTDTTGSTDSSASTKDQLWTSSSTITDITGSSTEVNTITKVPSTESSSVTNLPSNNTDPTSETTDNPTSGYSTTDASLTYHHNLTGYILQN